MREMIRDVVEDALVPLRLERALSVNETHALAANPTAMATEILDMRFMTKICTYGLCILAFLVWILLISRR